MITYKVIHNFYIKSLVSMFINFISNFTCYSLHAHKDVDRILYKDYVLRNLREIYQVFKTLNMLKAYNSEPLLALLYAV